MRPPILSLRFLKVVHAAFKASPSEAVRALGELLHGRKLRAWNRLCVIAATSADYYVRWIGATEPVATRRWCDRGNATASTGPAVLAILQATPGASPEASAAAKDSVRKAFGGSGKVAECAPGTSWRTVLAQHDAEWILPFTAGDLFAPSLGRVWASCQPGETAARAYYWDEDRIVDGVRKDPWIKPGWDRLLFGQHGGLWGAAIVHRSVLLASAQHDLAAGAENSTLSRDVALAQTIDQIAQEAVCHIPLILTHRAGPRVISRPTTFNRSGMQPTVSIIIPTRDKPMLLRTCVDGLARLCYPGPVETIIVDNGSTDPDAMALLASLETKDNVHVLRMPGPFNFSRLNNIAVQRAQGELLCLLNNDIEPLDGQWLSTLVHHAAASDVGAVGPLLLYPDQTVQHAGVVIGMGQAAGHVQRGVPNNCTEHWHWTFATRQVSAVTGACLVTAKAKYVEVGGLDEDAFPVAFNDVDFCLKLDRAGYRNIYVADTCLIHHESQSRGLDLTPAKAARFREELRQLQLRWNTTDADDPHFSKAFSKSSERCVLAL